MQTIGEGVLALCLQWILWPPEASDVVVDFFLGRNLDQLNRTFAPIPNGLCPQAGALLKTRFDILIFEKVFFPLHQSETARVEIGKRADLQIAWVAERPPQCFPTAVVDGDTVRIVHRGTEVIDLDSIKIGRASCREGVHIAEDARAAQDK